MDKQQLLAAIHARDSRDGIVTADRYFRGVEGCFDGRFCPVKLEAATSEDQWRKSLLESESKLTFSTANNRISKRSLKKSTDGGILTFDAIVTTPARDRDGDILLTKGAQVDMDMPLLWQHIPMSPIGKLVKVLKQDDNELLCRFAVADTTLGRDAAKLIRIGALRMSHGFEPLEWEPMDDEQGFLFKSYKIFEASVVSIPSNPTARITSISKSKFHSPLVRGWLSHVKGATEFESCTCKTPKSPMSHKSHKNVIVKEFDVERQHLEASKLEYDWISRFCSCEVKQLVNLGTFAARIRMGSFLTGLKNALVKTVQVDARRLTSGGHETPLEYETIQLNSKTSDNFLVDGISFRKTDSGICFAVKFDRQWMGEGVEIFCAQKDISAVENILGDAWTWCEQNNFLKGEAFSLGGEFLPKTSETWGDVFLEHVNETEVKRTVDLLNSKGKNCPNRGQVFAGPPGTGKTLSCRLMRNYADATFIWIGGKDAYRFGGINAVTQAFELAKELSPAIVVMEDIDASLDSRFAIDVLKSEMDGVGRSSGIVTVLTTNHPKSFPEALLDRPGRFHDVLKFDLPSGEIRNQMLQKWLPGLTEESLKKCVADTQGYSGAHVYELCQYAKNLRDEDDGNVNDSVLKALKKIHDQRELINQELLGDRVMASRRRENTPEIQKSRTITKGYGFKAGAKLSAETKGHINEAMADVNEICNCGDATRSILALAKSCGNHLKMAMGDEEVQKDFELELKEHDILSSARTPSFEGTEDTSWADVSKTFEAFRDGYYKHGGTKSDTPPAGVEDAPAEMLAWMASKSLLGKADGKTFSDVVFFPVVDPSTNKLNAGALRAVLSGRGSQANISEAAKTSAQNKAKALLEEHFKKSFEQISIEYMAELAVANTDVLRREHRRVSLMLRHSEEQESAREWEELFSDLS